MAKVVFDGNAKLISINLGEHFINVKADIYTEWKKWVLSDPINMGYEQALSVVGGESTIGVNVITPYFFLLNGWKIRPSEENHTLQIDGIIITSDQSDPFVDTVGTFNIRVQSIVPLKTETVVIDNTIPLDEDAPTWITTTGISNVSQSGEFINISWGTAADLNEVSYKVFISSNPGNIWDTSSLLGNFNNNSLSISTEADGVTQLDEIIYYIGVRATDDRGNVTTNTNTLNIAYSNPTTGDLLTGADITAITNSIWGNSTRSLTESGLTAAEQAQLSDVQDSINNTVEVKINEIIATLGEGPITVDEVESAFSGIKIII